MGVRDDSLGSSCKKTRKETGIFRALSPGGRGYPGPTAILWGTRNRALRQCGTIQPPGQRDMVKGLSSFKQWARRWVRQVFQVFQRNHGHPGGQMGGVGVGRSGLGCEYCVHHHWAPICPASPPSIQSSASHDLSSVPHSCLSLAGTISLSSG